MATNNTSALADYAFYVLTEAVIPELPNYYRGKVRENYDLPGGRRIIIATDRLSAFDQVLTAIPLKGQILTQIARFWFDKTADVCPNHVIDYPDPNVLLCKTLNIMPVEIVVRDYMAGATSTSILSMYAAGRRDMYGHRFADGMKPNEKLPETIITPTSKAFDAGHDEEMSAEQIVAGGILTATQWADVSERALALFARGREIAGERGLILADTKYEFGYDGAGNLILADEVHTPDSSRYWFAESYPGRFAAGEKPESFDKDFIRNWVVARCDPYVDPVPAIPVEVTLDAAAIYIDVYEAITGTQFPLPAIDQPVLERIRANLKKYF